MGVSGKQHRRHSSKRHHRSKLMRYAGPGAVGFAIGLAVMYLAGGGGGTGGGDAGALMERTSPMGLEQTAQALQNGFSQQGWTPLPLIDLNNMLSNQGVTLTQRASIVCALRGDALKSTLTSNMGASCMIPLRVAVYEDGKGGVAVACPNTAFLKSTMGSTVARDVEKVFADVLGEAKAGAAEGEEAPAGKKGGRVKVEE